MTKLLYNKLSTKNYVLSNSFFFPLQSHKVKCFKTFSLELRSCEFAYNNKGGAKKGPAYSKAKAALLMDDE